MSKNKLIIRGGKTPQGNNILTSADVVEGVDERQTLTILDNVLAFFRSLTVAGYDTSTLEITCEHPGTNAKDETQSKPG